jgi:hypothetical protein
VRVIQVNKFHFVKGGAERYYVDLSAALVRAGHEVNHLAMAHPRNLPGGAHDRFVAEVDYRAHLGFREKLCQAARTIHNREAVRLAGEMARRDRPAQAHLHNIYHQLSPSVIDAFVRAGVPVVQTLHDYKLVCPAYLLRTEGAVCERCRCDCEHCATSYRRQPLLHQLQLRRRFDPATLLHRQSDADRRCLRGPLLWPHAAGGAVEQQWIE